jgi:Leucine-rich repeat (LRR) protein
VPGPQTLCCHAPPKKNRDLSWLSLDHNNLTSVPDSLCQLAQLQHLEVRRAARRG